MKILIKINLHNYQRVNCFHMAKKLVLFFLHHIVNISEVESHGDKIRFSLPPFHLQGFKGDFLFLKVLTLTVANLNEKCHEYPSALVISFNSIIVQIYCLCFKNVQPPSSTQQ